MVKGPKEIDSSILQIDSDTLDEEWLGQPEMFYKYAARLAEADKALDEAKQELEVVEAEMDRRIRLAPTKYGLEKITDKGIEKAIIRTSQYQAAISEVTEAKYQVGILSAMTKALDQRKMALQSLVQLHGQNYFSTPRATGSEARETVRDFERKNKPKSTVKRRRDEEEDDDD